MVCDTTRLACFSMRGIVFVVCLSRFTVACWSNCWLGLYCTCFPQLGGGRGVVLDLVRFVPVTAAAAAPRAAKREPQKYSLGRKKRNKIFPLSPPTPAPDTLVSLLCAHSNLNNHMHSKDSTGPPPKPNARAACGRDGRVPPTLVNRSSCCVLLTHNT